jgi:hypothetical protein
MQPMRVSGLLARVNGYDALDVHFVDLEIKSPPGLGHAISRILDAKTTNRK